MNEDASNRIVGVWAAIEENEPDISTERLIQMTAETCHCDVGDVAEALQKSALIVENTRRGR